MFLVLSVTAVLTAVVLIWCTLAISAEADEPDAHREALIAQAERLVAAAFEALEDGER